MPREALVQMFNERKDCVWCGSELAAKESEHRHEPHFCSDCHSIFETEAHRPMNAVEIRHPHND